MSKDKKACELKNGQSYEPRNGADRLKAMFEAQRSLARKVGYDFFSMTDTQRQAHLKDLVLDTMVEQAEVLDWINWKEWKKEKKEFNKPQVLFEMVDTLCFLLQQVMCCGFNEEDLFQYFMRKVEINHERQDRNS